MKRPEVDMFPCRGCNPFAFHGPVSHAPRCLSNCDDVVCGSIEDITGFL